MTQFCVQEQILKAAYCEGKPIRIGDVVGSVRGLDNHALPDQRITGKIQLVACATPSVFGATPSECLFDVDASIAISHRVVDGPWLLFGTLVCATAVTASTGVNIRGLVIGCT